MEPALSLHFSSNVLACFFACNESQIGCAALYAFELVSVSWFSQMCNADCDLHLSCSIQPL